MGAVLLMLPIASAAGTSTSAVVAFFTATSAVTDTGLEVVPTPLYWSGFGKVVIMVLMALGGLGIMTLVTFILVVLGQRVTLPNRMVLRESLAHQGFGGLIRLLFYVMAVVVVFNLLGAIVLFLAFRSDYTNWQAIWQGLFHSIAAFNNAGFSILEDSSSLSRFWNQYDVLVPMATLVIIGGISYTVIIDVLGKHRFSRLSLDTKLVLTANLALWVLGYLVMLLAELRNPQTLGHLSPVDRGMAALFHSVSARTAGFSTIDFGSVEQVTKLFYVGLMFVGGAVGSTAGGIKVNTFAILMAAVFSSIRGRMQAEAFGREIPFWQVHRALSIAFLGLAMTFGITLLLLATEPTTPYIDLLFETISAFATVGLSTGITPELSLAGKALIMLTMFVGKLGPLTLVLILASSEERPLYRFAEERVKIG